MATTFLPSLGSARMILASNLRRLRMARGWSQEDLAFEAELHRTFVAHVERGARNISLDNLEKLAVALAIPTYKLIEPDLGEAKLSQPLQHS